MKSGLALGGEISGAVLALVSYDPNQEQTGSDKFGILL